MTPEERMVMRAICNAVAEDDWKPTSHGERIQSRLNFTISARGGWPACLDALDVAEAIVERVKIREAVLPLKNREIECLSKRIAELEKRSKLFEDCLIGINTAVGDEPPEDLSDPAYYDYLMRVKITLADKDERIAELEAELERLGFRHKFIGGSHER